MRRLVTRSFFGQFSRRALALTIAFVLLAGYASFRVSAYSGGITGVTQKSGGSGCSCHNASSSSSTSVSITTSATTFEVGQSYTFTVTVSNSAKAGAGVNIAVDNGTLTAGSGLKKSGNELTHDPKKTSLPASWTFTYTAPNTPGEDKIYATGNAINNDGANSSADVWNHATTFVIDVEEPPSRLIALSKTTINMGNVRVGRTKQDTMRIFSQGDEALTINSSAPKNSSPFTSSPSSTNRTINTGSEELNTITFAPSTKGSFVDTLVINNNSTVAANTRKTVVLIGTGTQGAFNGANSMAFGDVKVNLTKRIGYVFTNNGDDSLFLNAPSISGSGYTIVTPPTRLSLAPNEKDSVVIQLAPTAKQTYTGTLTITAQGGVTTPSISLAGNGVAPSIQHVPSLNIGGIRVGLTNQSTINFTNNGNDTLKVTQAQFTAGAVARFSISGSAVQSVMAGEQGVININHTPDNEIADTVTLTIVSNALNTPTTTMTIIGTGTMPRMLVASGTKLEFGSVSTGKSAILSFQVQNPGTDILTLGPVNTAAPFTLDNKPSTIEAKQNGTVSIKFAPTQTGEFSGIVIINGDDPANTSDTVIVTGTGVKSALSLESNLDFGSLPVGTESILDLTLTNEGTAAVTIFSYKLNNNAHASFRIVDSAAHSVAVGASATVKVGFKPMTAAAFTAQLAIAVDDNSAPLRTVALSGTGIQGQLQVTPTSLDFGKVDSGTTSASKTVTLKNTGLAPISITNFSTTCSMQPLEFVVSGITPPVTIPASGEVTITVAYAPKNRGIDQCAVSVISEGNTHTVQLRGEGLGKDDTTQGAVKVISPIADYKLRISPNPVSGTAIVNLKMTRTADVELRIYDMTGREVTFVSSHHMPIGENSISLSTLGLPNGEYFLIATSEGQMAGEAKIVVQR